MASSQTKHEQQPIADTDLNDTPRLLDLTYTDTTISETIVVDGYGISLRVDRGELEIADGLGAHRRTRRIRRAEATAGQVRRIVVLGTGTISTQAHAWCQAVGVALVVCGPGGQVHSVGAPETFVHGALRRAQALAPYTPTGMHIAHHLLDLRLRDQARIAGELLGRGDRAGAITEQLPALTEAEDSAAVMVVEMRAAEHYWSAWTDEVHLTFIAKDRARVPVGWTRFRGRSSPLNEAPGNRHAATPINALLNYGVRLAEIEATLVCRVMGLDPALGVLHADGLNRDALVLDLIEPARGTVETTVLELAGHQAFRKADFTEAADGEIRVLAPLSHEFAQLLLPRLRERLGPVVEDVAGLFAEVSATKLTVPTPLSRSRHKTARRRSDRDAVTPSRPRRRTAGAIEAACLDCGTPVSDPRRIRCDTCINTDPTQTPEIRGRRGKAIAARRRQAAAWEAAGGKGDFNPDDWAQIQASLTAIKLADIMAATGFSKSFASVVRAGKSRPHPSQWPALAALR